MNPEVALTLDDAVAEVLARLTGMDLTYQPEYDRYQVITRLLNQATRANALENEWSYYSDVEEVGTAHAGDTSLSLRASVRPRIINDDAVRLVDPEDGKVIVWAYFLPRDALHKYDGRGGLWVAHSRSSLHFSRALKDVEDGLTIQVPVMREPRMFRLPRQSDGTPDVVPDAIREQTIDFDFPDVIVLRAAFLYAQTDPVMQPRAMALEDQYRNLMFQLIERDTRNTDSPFLNEFFVPIEGSLNPSYYPASMHGHPHSDERR